MSKQLETLVNSNVIRSSSSDGLSERTQQEIRERAYQLFEERGAEPGHDVEDWLKAESEVLRHSILQRAA